MSSEKRSSNWAAQATRFSYWSSRMKFLANSLYLLMWSRGDIVPDCFSTGMRTRAYAKWDSRERSQSTLCSFFPFSIPSLRHLIWLNVTFLCHLSLELIWLSVTVESCCLRASTFCLRAQNKVLEALCAFKKCRPIVGYCGESRAYFLFPPGSSRAIFFYIGVIASFASIRRYRKVTIC